jgi:hypothetical protein
VGSPLDVVINALEQNKWDHASEQARALLEAAPVLLEALKAVEKFYLPTPVKIQVRNALIAAELTL